MIVGAGHTEAWALWLALGLGILNIVLWGVVVVLARRLLAQVKPWLPMLFPLTTTTNTGGNPASAGGSSIVTGGGTEEAQ